MDGILLLNNLNKSEILAQGDNSPLKYELAYADGRDFDYLDRPATVRLKTYSNSQIGYETETTVKQNNIIEFYIDKTLPARTYFIEVTIKYDSNINYIFPSKDKKQPLIIHESSHGQDIEIIKTIGIKEVATKTAKYMLAEGYTGPQGPQGPKGDIPIIYSATPPVDTDIIWVDETEEVPTKADKTYVDAELDKKVNKQQEDWITPTLLNGWTDFGGIYETIGYMKDELGFVHIKGMVKDGSVGAILFTLPKGYRPLKFQYHPCFSRDVLNTLTIRDNGDVFIPASASNVWLTLNGISFKAEA